ncbi:apolipoprotein C-I [Erinaceus europaeus]|uniref:Apolipoprotein C-I n=1 Tax=Erinaceus europaeus TaxID=9365 RepID=A0A1S3WNK4_ERIEU|nr:apolipoprotein C-I [Erinaceus europaeus]
MRLLLSLPVLAGVLLMLLEGPAPAQAAPDFSSTLEEIQSKLKTFGSSVSEKTRAIVDKIKEKEITTKARNWFLDTVTKLKEKLNIKD